MLIVHVSDLHIRAGGDYASSRYHEYAHAFCNLIEVIKRIKTDHAGRPLCVALTGDVFHSKSRIDAPGVHLFTQLLTGVSALAPVVVIEGNHDFAQQDRESFGLIDAFSAVIARLGNVAYVSETGFRNWAGGLGVGVVSVRDLLDCGSSSGPSERYVALPAAPCPCPARPGTCNVLLMHTCKVPCSTDLGVLGYDACLLGDQHRRAVYECKAASLEDWPEMAASAAAVWGFAEGRVPCGHAGSLIQQNFGEAVDGHGVLVWDMDRRMVAEVDVESPVGYATAEALVLRMRESSSIPPFQKLHVRGELDAETRLFLRNACGVKELHEIGPPSPAHSPLLSADSTTPTMTTIGKPPSGEPAAAFSVQACVEFVASSPDHADDWKRWLAAPERLVGVLRNLSSAIADPGVRGRVESQRVAALERAVQAFHARTPTVHHPTNNKGRFAMRRMEWSWLMCFGPDNVLSWDDLRGKVALLSAPNAYGKSSVVDVLCLGLFGECQPCRKGGGKGAAVNVHANGEEARVAVQFDVGATTYEVRRSGFRSGPGAGSSAFVSVVTRAPDNRSVVHSPLHKGKTSVNEWVAKTVGTMDMFLTSCVVAQNSRDADFFCMSAADQMAGLDRATGMDEAQVLSRLLDQARRDIRYVTDLVEASKPAAPAKCSSEAQRAYDDAVAAAGELEALAPMADAVAASGRVAARPEAAAWFRANRDREAELRDLERRLAEAVDMGEWTSRNVWGASPSQLAPPFPSFAKIRAAALDAVTTRADLADVVADAPTMDARAIAQIEAQLRVPSNNEQGEEEEDPGEEAMQAAVRAVREAESARPAAPAAAVTMMTRNQIEAWKARFRELDPPRRLPGAREAAEADKKRQEIEDEIRRLEGRAIPHNPECWACKKQDWRVRLDALRTELGALPPPQSGGQILPMSEVREMEELVARREDARLSALAIKAEERLEAARADLRSLAERRAAAERGRVAAQLAVEKAKLARGERLRKAWCKATAILAFVREVLDGSWSGEALSKARMAVCRAEAELQTARDAEETIRKASAKVDEGRALQASVTKLCAVFNGYRTWHYERRVLPALCGVANALLARAGVHGELSAAKAEEAGGGFAWRLGGMALEHASGFQRFALCIAIKVAMARMHVASVDSATFVVDEGFASCDSSNLARVPAFMEGLLAHYDHVLVMSHSEHVKDAAGVEVEIERKVLGPCGAAVSVMRAA